MQREHKTELITLRVTPRVKEAIRKRAREAGLTVTDYLCYSGLGKEIVRVDGLDKVLLEKIDPGGVEGLTPNSLSHKIRKSVDTLRRSGIVVTFRRSNGERLICLRRGDGVDDLPAGKIVTIDPVGNVLPSTGDPGETQRSGFAGEKEEARSE